jgi:uncharacterized protein
MRKIIACLLFLIVLGLCACALEQLAFWVNDEAGVIDASHEQLIVSELEQLKADTGAEVAVATVSTTAHVPIEEYSINLAHNVLGEKGKDNGLLILVAVDDRKWRIEIGYGLEPYITDALAGRIGREVMVPYFQQNDYQEGILQGVKAVKAVLMNETGYELTPAPNYQISQIMQALVPLIIFLVWLIIFASFIRHKRHREDKIFQGAWMAAILFGHRGRGGLGGFSGGFGGFGGGGFGGGGAGGGW